MDHIAIIMVPVAVKINDSAHTEHAAERARKAATSRYKTIVTGVPGKPTVAPNVLMVYPADLEKIDDSPPSAA